MKETTITLGPIDKEITLTFHPDPHHVGCLQINTNPLDGDANHGIDIMDEEDAYNHICEKWCVRDLTTFGNGRSLLLETGLVWVYVGQDEEFFITNEDLELLNRLGITDEAEELMEKELEKFCKAKRIAA